jgi:hypothetical protein
MGPELWNYFLTLAERLQELQDHGTTLQGQTEGPPTSRDAQKRRESTMNISSNIFDWPPIAQFKAKTTMANAWAALPDDQRNELCDFGETNGEVGFRWRQQGASIVFYWAGVDLAMVEAAWLFDDSMTDFPEAELISLEAPDTIPIEWFEDDGGLGVGE